LLTLIILISLMSFTTCAQPVYQTQGDSNVPIPSAATAIPSPEQEPEIKQPSPSDKPETTEPTWSPTQTKAIAELESLPPLEEIAARQIEMGWKEYGRDTIRQYLLEHENEFSYHMVDSQRAAIGRYYINLEPDGFENSDQTETEIEIHTHWDEKSFRLYFYRMNAENEDDYYWATPDMQYVKDVLTVLVMFADRSLNKNTANTKALALLDSISGNGSTRVDTLESDSYTIQVYGNEKNISAFVARYKYDWLPDAFDIKDYMPAPSEIIYPQKKPVKYYVQGVVEQIDTTSRHIKCTVRDKDDNRYTEEWKYSSASESGLPFMCQEGYEYIFYGQSTHKGGICRRNTIH
jgi:hypothetical protein